MKLFYIAFLIILWLNIFLGNEVIHTLTVLITTLYIVNRRKRLKMTQLNEIINAIRSLFESESGYKISKKFRGAVSDRTRFEER